VHALSKLRRCCWILTTCAAALLALQQACDCKAGIQKISGLALPIVSKVPDQTMALFTNLFKVRAANASSVDAIAQWVAASAAKMPLPKIPINATSLGECRCPRRLHYPN
jgi:hypothetical protein